MYAIAPTALLRRGAQETFLQVSLLIKKGGGGFSQLQMAVSLLLLLLFLKKCIFKPKDWIGLVNIISSDNINSSMGERKKSVWCLETDKRDKAHPVWLFSSSLLKSVSQYKETGTQWTWDRDLFVCLCVCALLITGFITNPCVLCST